MSFRYQDSFGIPYIVPPDDEKITALPTLYTKAKFNRSSVVEISLSMSSFDVAGKVVLIKWITVSILSKFGRN